MQVPQGRITKASYGRAERSEERGVCNMAFLFHDIVLDDSAFETASNDMAALKQEAADLKTMLEKMYDDVTTALDTSAGDEIQFTAKNVLLQPIEDMSIVIQHISDTLNTIIGTGYYKDIFVKFEELNE